MKDFSIKSTYYSLLVALFILLGNIANANEQIRVVGSSTVYPFITVVAEEFGRKTGFRAPIVESSGTGGGFRLFCAGVGRNTPDLSNASRAILDSERELCRKNGVTGITEIKIGYDGIVIAKKAGNKNFNLTKKQIFAAVARQVPQNGKLVNNPNKTWQDIDKSLPATRIEIYGPPPTSGTRDAFVELVMEEACTGLPEFAAAYPDKVDRKYACHMVREDGVYIDAGENDNLIVQRLISNPDAIGIFGYSYLEENESQLQAASIDGVLPDFDNIAGGKYPVARSLYVYLKDQNLASTKGLREFVEELVSDAAIGSAGYLTFRGLIPLGQDELEQMRSGILR